MHAQKGSKKKKKWFKDCEQACYITLDMLLGHGAEYFSLSKPRVEEAAVVQARPITDTLTPLILAIVIGSKLST